MLFLDAANLVVLCMPKCASTSIHAALKRHSSMSCSKNALLKHTTARIFETHLRPYLSAQLPGQTAEEIETVCLFREPLSWVHSWYKYRSRADLSSPESVAHARYTGNLQFAEFVEEFVSTRPRPFAQIGSQINFVTDAQGKVILDYIFRFEEIETFFSFISGRLQREIEFPRRNESPQLGDAEGSAQLDPGLRARIQRVLAREYELYEKLPRIRNAADDETRRPPHQPGPQRASALGTQSEPQRANALGTQPEPQRASALGARSARDTSQAAPK